MSEDLRIQAVTLYGRGLQAITPGVLMRRAVEVSGDTLQVRFLDRSERVELTAGGRLVLVAVGKAAAPMAGEAHRILGSRIDAGLVVTKTGFALPGLPYPTREAAHPVPDEAGVAAAEEVARVAGGLNSGDLLLVLVSGGASALLPAPIAGISLADKQRIVEAMLRTEMDIHEINRVRKAVSRIKGGGLAALAAPARVLGLYLSDVPGDGLASIGSGPTVPDPVDAPAVIELLRRKGIWEGAPEPLRRALESGAAVKDFSDLSAPPVNGLIGTNRHLLHAIRAAAEEAGYAVRVEEAPTTGLNAEALPRLLERWEAYRRAAPPGNRPLCLVSGGETVVQVTGQGLGGRCQELAAQMMPRLDERSVFLAAGSDGNDGPTDAAGGVVDRESWLRVQAEDIPYSALLADHDSYRLLERSRNLIKVPPTRNNVMDVHLFLGER